MTSGALRWAMAALAFALLAALVILPADLLPPARAALAVFGTAVILWTTTRLDAAWIAFAAAVALVPLQAADQAELMAMLGHNIIWLMAGAFVIGAAIQSSGLAARITGGIAARARTTAQLFWLTTLALIPLTFLIPSTSGRAAAALPALNLLPADAADTRRRAFALLIPVVILVATSAALTGAGSHLLAQDLLDQRLGERFGFANWALWGLPFAAVSSAIACGVILRLFLTPAQRGAAIEAGATTDRAALSGTEWRVIVVAATTFGLWFTTDWHGLEIATVAILAMIALTAPRVGVMSFKAGMKAVNWSLILFVGGAMLLGQALINTQAAGWLIDRLFALAGLEGSRAGTLPEIAVVGAVALISTASHLFLTSHVARTAALGPPFILMAQSAGIEPIAVLFIATVGMNYCLTLPACSKALLLFQDVDGGGFRPADLLRLSAVLAPINVALMIAAYFAWWKWTGLAL
ncbi:MAG: SLC13 family permease [Sphingopyxis sp.]|uniref:SLC13 family permease n=1 Tax=Sphingopyxis sp. TaxID=1908224 RepID=UPI003D80F6C6